MVLRLQAAHTIRLDRPECHSGRPKRAWMVTVIQGGAVYINTGSSPTIRNCVIRDTDITGGNAGSGGNADATTPAGRGGWGGWARGGGVYIAPFANPTLINCTITNCTVTGGNAGNGGNSSGTYGVDYQDADHGGLWSNAFNIPWWELIGSDGQPVYRRLHVLQRPRRRRVLRRKLQANLHRLQYHK